MSSNFVVQPFEGSLAGMTGVHDLNHTKKFFHSNIM
jgi:hypothetical protein